MIKKIKDLQMKIVKAKLENKPFEYIRMLQQQLDKIYRKQKDGTL